MLDKEVRSSHVLIEFDTIVDVDYGILCTIYEKYYDTDIFSKQLLELSPEEWLGLLHDNPKENPISVLVEPEYEPYIDDYLRQLKAENLEHIYKKACFTNMIRFIYNAINTNRLCIVDILCRSRGEYDIMKKFLKDQDANHYHILLHTTDNPFNAKQYDTIFIKNAKSLFKYTNLEEKQILIAELMYNIDEDMYWREEGIVPKKLYTALHSESNTINTFRLYDYNKNYFIGRNYPYSDDEPVFIDEFMNPGNSDPVDDDEAPMDMPVEQPTEIQDDDFDLPGFEDIKTLKEEDYVYK